ncbi:MAG: heme NO-binding protein [Candidatus Latescibacteria bacterium]|nr:heme NO-binding protein [bacterium]MBD3424588.1 heme NO-binding protein [Candidatus Latescibacterota bacterium]
MIMKGIINKGIEELVEETLGQDKWKEIKEKAGCDEPFFSASEDYPDQMTLDLAVAAAEVSGLAIEDVMVEFGKFWISNTGAKAYSAFFNLAGSSAREFLINMDRVHRQVTRNMKNARPPHFEYEELPDGRLLMHYQSERKLCKVLKGLILGVGIYFGEELQVKETACMSEGDPRCTMEVIFL